MQLDLSAFNPHPQLQVRELPSPMPGAPNATNDECRHRDGDVIPFRDLAPGAPSAQPNQSLHALERLNRTPGALKGADLKTINSRTDLMIVLNQNLPLNEFQLPKFIYRPDLLDYTLFNQSNTTDAEDRERFIAMQDSLNSSTIQLQYHEGYPALPNGKTFWSQFDYETIEEFDLFQQYLSIPGARQLGLIASAVAGGLEEVQGLFHTHYWALRCLAHDTFAVAHFQRLREQRILSTDNVHFLKAEELLSRVYAMFNELDLATLKSDPKAFVDVMEKLQKLQRTALGQASNGQPGEAKPQSLELIMRNLGQANQVVLEGNSSRSSTDELLNDPETAASAQELIIRMNK